MARMKTAEDDSSGALRPTNSPRRTSTQNFYSFPSTLIAPFLRRFSRNSKRLDRVSILDIVAPSSSYQFLLPLPTRLVKGLIDAIRNSFNNQCETVAGEKSRIERAFIPWKRNVSKFISSFREKKRKRKENSKRVNLNRAVTNRSPVSRPESFR